MRGGLERGGAARGELPAAGAGPGPLRGGTWREPAKGVRGSRGSAVADTLVARPGEFRLYVFDFSLLPELVAGDTLAGPPVITATPAGLTVGTPGISGKTVTATITAGTVERDYQVSCSCTTAGGSTLVCEGRLEVST